MEIWNLVLRSAKTQLILFFFLFASCSAQKKVMLEEEKIYSLIEFHYNLNQIENPAKFLYFESLSIKESPNFHWTKELKLSKFLSDSVFIKECSKILIFLDDDVKDELNVRFANLESTVFDENKFSKNILNRKYLQQETYNKVPDAANRKLSYPIILRGESRTYGVFVEDAHNEGGNLYFYEFKNNEWQLVCKDSLWLV